MTPPIHRVIESDRLREKKERFRFEGRTARAKGAPISSCPYAETSWSGGLWRDGWNGE